MIGDKRLKTDRSMGEKRSFFFEIGNQKQIAFCSFSFEM